MPLFAILPFIGLEFLGGSGSTKTRSPDSREPGLFACYSLTITYFHTGCSTIIGVESFHGPVRDGKGWFQLAMVIRHYL
jgi:hypothetical protein